MKPSAAAIESAVAWPARNSWLRRSRPGPRDSSRRWRHGRAAPAPARQSRAPPATPPARGIPAAAFARGAARSASRRARSRASGNGPSPGGRNSSACAARGRSGDGTSHCCMRSGSPSAPCAPKRGLRLRAPADEAGQPDQRRKQLERMHRNLDLDRESEATEMDCRQNSRRRIKSGAFFRERRRCEACRSGVAATVRPTACSPARRPPAVCPLSVQPNAEN